MENTLAITPKYGAVELKAVAKKYMMAGVIISSVSIILFILGYYGIQKLLEEEAPVYTVRVLKYSDLGPPPSISQQAAPAVAIAGPVIRPSIGVPVPVPDAEVSPEQTIMSQVEMSAQSAPAVDIGPGAGGGEIQIEDDGPPPDFVAYEKQPEIIKKVEPKYPELARKAGLEGRVYVKVWVTKEGTVKQAVIQKSDAQIFEEAALEAAKQYVFTPAIMQNGPVAVWVSLPFRFTLRESK